MRSVIIIFVALLCMSSGCMSGGNKMNRYQSGGSGKSGYIVKKELAKVDPSKKVQTTNKTSLTGNTGGIPKFASSVPTFFNVGTTFDGKPLFLIKTVKISSTSVTLNVWDDALEDGDIITLYLNGRAIVSNFRLTNSKFSIKANLNKGKKNTLYLYAHNLGEYPPNTAAIELRAEDETRNFVLSSTLESSQGVEIEVK